MSKRESILRQISIINKLSRNKLTFEEISDYLQEESDIRKYNLNVSKRTSQRDLNDIRSVYNIDIQNNRSDNRYFIVEDGLSEMNERIIEAFNTFNALNISDRLSNHIHFETRKPQGTENLHGLLHTILLWKFFR